MSEELQIEERDGAVVVAVRVTPRASRDRVGGLHAGALKVTLTAPPVEGAANAALVALLAKRLGVAKSAVILVSGERGRDKRVRIEGVDPDAVRALV